MTSPGPGTRLCDYCDAPFTPVAPSQRYCKKNHQLKAARKRRHGLEPRTLPVRSVPCPWCGRVFETTNRDQLFCGLAHKRLAAACRSKQAYPSLASASRTAQGYTGDGEVEPYRCLCWDGDTHWHLKTRTGDPA